MLLCSKQLPVVCNRPFLHTAIVSAAPTRSFVESQSSFTTARHGLAASAVAKASKAANSHQQPAAADRVLFIGGLPGEIAADILYQQLAEACNQCSLRPTLIEVAQFVDDAQRSGFQVGWKHKGHALVAFTSAEAVQAAAAAVQQVPFWGQQAVVGPARKLPKHWTPDVTMSPEELTALQQQQAATAARREHNKRQRQRQQQRLVTSVDQILQALPAPAGTAVLQQYKPLLGRLLTPQASFTATSAHITNNINSHDTSRGGTHDHLLDHTDSILHTLLQAMPNPLHSVLRVDALRQLLNQQQQQQRSHHQQLIRLAAKPSVADVAGQLLFDWSKMPKVVDPAFGGQLADADVVRAGAGKMNMRALRKHVQVESFALLLLQLTLPALQANTPLHVVEFGCGSGNLVLPLAHLFPNFLFTAVDMKHSAVQLLQQRIQQGGITNVSVIQGTIEQYTGDADVVLALHACGAASDWSLLQAKRCGAAFLVSPCCIGKISKNNTAGLAYGKQRTTVLSSTQGSAGAAVDAASEVHMQQQQQMVTVQQPTQQQVALQYPRSQWLTQHMSQLSQQVLQEQQAPSLPSSQQNVPTPLQQAVLSSGASDRCRSVFSLLAQAADYSHQEEHGYPELAALAKSNVEFDRGLSMSEMGYEVELVRLLQPELTAKSDVLIGAPKKGSGS